MLKDTIIEEVRQIRKEIEKDRLKNRLDAEVRVYTSAI
jgi:hypothetical protein